MVCVPALQKKLLDTCRTPEFCTVAFRHREIPYNVQVTFGPLPLLTLKFPGHGMLPSVMTSMVSAEPEPLDANTPPVTKMFPPMVMGFHTYSGRACQVYRLAPVLLTVTSPAIVLPDIPRSTFAVWRAFPHEIVEILICVARLTPTDVPCHLHVEPAASAYRDRPVVLGMLVHAPLAQSSCWCHPVSPDSAGYLQRRLQIDTDGIRGLNRYEFRTRWGRRALTHDERRTVATSPPRSSFLLRHSGSLRSIAQRVP